MGRGEADERAPEGSAKRGLWRLMLRLPALRGRLQILTGRSDSLVDLCEAYEDASFTLDRMLREPGSANAAMIKEYQTICSEIESDVIQYCLERPSDVPQ
ncbi:hypothetical protein PR017_20485 (plasmid) [Rhizobium tumorigenes]|uniref:Nodulation protein n=1 Tax=Rhizobium tumorigenes TaxID=2041385 RepID=A0AAF1K8K7_9HYPH|nr:hypothetical protein [Rhizobium tumorigenes]WFR98137.1 hypothetical protein PR017_20485 [Rhizobium tumorigenes]WFS03660.1 hypothetical protein PR016_21230 [Rhizobium tumorigenes]